MIAKSSCLITGGGGFIGLHLAHKLKKYGFKVTILDINDVDAEEHQGIEFIKGSVLDEGMLKRLIPSHDYVFHLAALLGVRRTMTGPVSMINNNVLGTLYVLKTAMDSKSKVVFASTSEVYGKVTPPFREDGDLVFGTPSKLRWSYAIAKSLEESLCLGYGQQGLPVTIIRYFNVYGPRQKEGLYGGVIPRFVKSAIEGSDIPVYGNGLQTRSFTFIEDAVELTVRAAFESGANQHIINAGSENEISILELAAMVKRLSKSSSPITHIPFEQVYPNGFEEIPRRLPDMSKADHLLGHNARTPLEEGLVKTIRWYQERKGRTQP